MTSQSGTENGTGVTHDPLCTWRPYEQVRHTRKFLPCQCDMIAKVREDERRERVMLKEALDYYKAPITLAQRKGWHEGVSDCLTALRALQEKP
jgi:hypothetical protein